MEKWTIAQNKLKMANLGTALVFNKLILVVKINTNPSIIKNNQYGFNQSKYIFK